VQPWPDLRVPFGWFPEKRKGNMGKMMESCHEIPLHFRRHPKDWPLQGYFDAVYKFISGERI